MSDVFVTRETKLTKQKYIPIHDVDGHHRDEHGLRRSLVAPAVLYSRHYHAPAVLDTALTGPFRPYLNVDWCLPSFRRCSPTWRPPSLTHPPSFTRS